MKKNLFLITRKEEKLFLISPLWCYSNFFKILNYDRSINRTVLTVKFLIELWEIIYFYCHFSKSWRVLIFSLYVLFDHALTNQLFVCHTQRFNGNENSVSFQILMAKYVLSVHYNLAISLLLRLSILYQIWLNTHRFYLRAMIKQLLSTQQCRNYYR